MFPAHSVGELDCQVHHRIANDSCVLLELDDYRPCNEHKLLLDQVAAYLMKQPWLVCASSHPAVTIITQLGGSLNQ